MIVVEHQAPTRSRVEPIDGADPPIRRRDERFAVPGDVLEREIGAARLHQGYVAVETLAEAAISADLELGGGRIAAPG